MHDGIIEQIGTPLDLYDRPNNLFVAGFIGSPSMNFINGTLGPDGFRTDDGVVLPVKAGDTRQSAASAIYGIRPEHFRLDDAGVPIEVSVVEPTGSETQVLGRLGKQQVTGVFRERVDAKPGATIRVSPDTASVHLFDASGARLN
jgi:multiple sugar transport system ATP-binding protein